MTSIELIGKLETENVELSARIRNMQKQVSELIRRNAYLLANYKADTERMRKAIELKPDTLRQTIADFGKPKTVTVHVHKLDQSYAARTGYASPKERTNAVVSSRITSVLQHHSPLTRAELYHHVTGRWQTIYDVLGKLIAKGTVSDNGKKLWLSSQEAKKERAKRA